MKIIKWLYRVEVGSWKDAESVIEVAKQYNAMWKRGKAHGKPGAIKCCVYVEAEPFARGWHTGREMLRDVMARRVPGAETLWGDALDIVTEI
jgi:hypothetical protein